MSLPVKTTSDDVRTIVKYLKTKPTGASVSEAKAVSKKMVDGRKLAAYVTWGLITREDSKLKLTDRGWQLARHPDQEGGVFQEIISLMKPYRSALEWAYHQNLPSIDTNDVAAHWHDHHLDDVGEANANTLRDNAVCFFGVAEAGGLGSITLGRGGKATRLELARDQVAAYVEAGPTTPPWNETPDTEEGEAEVEAAEEAEDVPDAETNVPAAPDALAETSDPLRVFISHGSNHDIVEQIGVMLELADIEPEIAVAEETTAIPVPEKVLSAMRRCNAAIIAITVDENRKDEEGNYHLNENVLIEIGSAFVLYDRRVVLVWDKRLKVPSNLQGLYRCEFEGDELSWSAGMKLMKAIRGFKKPTAD
jgi:predicted nucleotide-binding protein